MYLYSNLVFCITHGDLTLRGMGVLERTSRIQVRVRLLRGGVKEKRLCFGFCLVKKKQQCVYRYTSHSQDSRIGRCLVYLWFRQCSCFCFAQTWFQSGLIFILISHSHRVALSDVGVLWNGLCPSAVSIRTKSAKWSPWSW